MNVICLQESAFYELIEKVYRHVECLQKKEHSEKWLSGEEAMNKLRIKSKSTLQMLRDKGCIEFSCISRKNILYNRHSIDKYIESKARRAFSP